MTKNEIVAVLAQVLVQNQRVKGFDTRCPDLLSERRMQLRLGPEHPWTPRGLESRPLLALPRVEQAGRC